MEAKTICDLPGLDPQSYARWRASTVGSITERLERRLILDLLGDVADRKVLDIGCGDGDLAADLCKRGAKVAGLDASETMIKAAIERAKQENLDIGFWVGTAQKLPFPAEEFDIVVAVTILCFVDDPAPVFREIARVLRPGGRLVIGELGKWSTWAAARRLRGWMGSMLWQKGKFRTARELRDLANQAGLEVEQLSGAIYYPRFGIAAKALAPLDPLLGRLTPVGAAFLALSAVKPGVASSRR